MRSVDLVRAEGEHEQHPDAAQRPHQERDEVKRRAVRPLEVLDDEHQRPVGGQPLDDAEHELEQTAAARLTPGGRSIRRLWIEFGE
jgi:hypothetical protein